MTETQSLATQHPTMAAMFLARAEDDNTALLFEDSSWTWRELVAEAGVRAAVLTELRPGGDRPWNVGLLMENTPEYLFTIAGAALCGATVVGVNPTRRGAELAADIRRVECDVLITGSAYSDLLEGIDHGARRIIDSEGEEYAALVARHQGAAPVPTEAALDPSTLLLLMFTSGSTGAPKAVICSTGRWAMASQTGAITLTSDDVAYNAMPLFHGNALMAAWGPCIKYGAAFAMRRKFSASGFLDDVLTFKATFFNYVGRSLAYVLAQPERPEEAQTSLRFGFGTEASARDRAEFERRYGIAVSESYGSSEGTVYIVHTPDTPEGALGKPLPMFTVDLCTPEGDLCPPARLSPDGVLLNAEEAIGEIVSRGVGARFEGYYNNPEATAEKIRNGDFWTGDLAYCDEQGFYWFAGRTADWLRVDSENFAAAPVERILARFPGVAVAAVYPVPDPRTGDQVMATLQLADPEGTVDPAAFTDFLAEQRDLGTKWAPRFVRVTTDLPVTATRKVDKPALRRMFWEDGDTDVVLERVDGAYRVLDDARRTALLEEYREHGRIALVGRPVNV